METPVFGSATGNLVQARRHFRLALTALERAHHGAQADREGTSDIQRTVDSTRGIIEEIDGMIFSITEA